MLSHIDRRTLPSIGWKRFQSLLDTLQKVNEGPVYFVEIGANDGEAGDPIYRRAIRYQWSGLLVEPIPDYFRRLQENYEGNPNVRFENAAIDREHGIRTMYRKGDLSSSSLMLNQNFADGVYKEEAVRVMSLEGLLQKHGVRQIDLLQIDAEGKDLEIIEDLDFTKYFPSVINFEANVLSDPHEVNQTLAKLQGLGYDLYNFSWDQADADITATTLKW